jgi:hypothetical protein
MSVTTSQLAAANEALAELKQIEGITAISDVAGTSTTQKYVTRFFDSTRKTVLRAHDWPFARANICVAPSQDQETGLWMLVIPTDCIRVLAVTACGAPVTYRIEGTFIVSTQEVDRIAYTTDVEDIDLWDPLARQALIEKLTARLSEPITGRLNAWEKYTRLYNNTIMEARIASGREQHKHYGDRADGSPAYPKAMSSRYGGSRPITTVEREIPTV